MFYLWSLYLTVLLVQTIRLDVAYTLGFSLAGGILTKTNAFFSLYLLPITILLCKFGKRERLRRILLLFVYFGLAIVMANGFYLLLELSPYYERILWFNGDFVYPKREWLQLSVPFRLNLLKINTLTLLDYWLNYLTVTYVAMIGTAFWFARRHRRLLLSMLVLLAYWLLPSFALAVFGRGIQSRWIYPFILPLLPIAAYGVYSSCEALIARIRAHSRVLKVCIAAVFVGLIVVYSIAQTVTFVIAPQRANLPRVDKWQYVSCANWTIRNMVLDLKIQAQHHKIFIGSRDPLGAGQEIGQTIQLYSLSSKNIIVEGFAIDKPSYPRNFFRYAQEMPAYFITYKQWQSEIKGASRMKLIKEVPSPYDPHCSTILEYRVI